MGNDNTKTFSYFFGIRGEGEVFRFGGHKPKMPAAGTVVTV